MYCQHQVCLEHCKQEGAAYMATQYGYECWCYVNGRADFDRHGDGAVCDIPCQGNEVPLPLLLRFGLSTKNGHTLQTA